MDVVNTIGGCWNGNPDRCTYPTGLRADGKEARSTLTPRPPAPASGRGGERHIGDRWVLFIANIRLIQTSFPLLPDSLAPLAASGSIGPGVRGLLAGLFGCFPKA
jgi:hypothetical protein